MTFVVQFSSNSRIITSFPCNICIFEFTPHPPTHILLKKNTVSWKSLSEGQNCYLNICSCFPCYYSHKAKNITPIKKRTKTFTFTKTPSILLAFSLPQICVATPTKRNRERAMAKLLMWFLGVFFVFTKLVDCYEFEEFFYNKTEGAFLESVYGASAAAPPPLMIGLTIIHGAAARGAG